MTAASATFAPCRCGGDAWPVLERKNTLAEKTPRPIAVACGGVGHQAGRTALIGDIVTRTSPSRVGRCLDCDGTSARMNHRMDFAVRLAGRRPFATLAVQKLAMSSSDSPLTTSEKSPNQQDGDHRDWRDERDDGGDQQLLG